MSYKDTNDYKKYPYLPGREEISLSYDPGVDEGLVNSSGELSGVGPPNEMAYVNRAYLNVDQFNFLVRKIKFNLPILSLILLMTIMKCFPTSRDRI